MTYSSNSDDDFDPVKSLTKEFPNISPEDVQPLITMCDCLTDLRDTRVMDRSEQRKIYAMYCINPEVKVEDFSNVKSIANVALIVFRVHIYWSELNKAKKDVDIDIPITLEGSFFAKWSKAYNNKEDYMPDVADRVARSFDEFDGLQRFIDTYDDNKDVLTPEDYAKAIKLAIRYARQYFLDYSHLSITKLQPTDSLNEPENGYVKDKDTFYRMPFTAKPTRFLVSDGLPYQFH